MIESGQSVTLVTGILSLGYFFTVHLFHVGDWGLLFFPVGWDFYVAKMVWRMFNCRCVRLRFLHDIVQLLGPPFHQFWLGFGWVCFVVFPCCFLPGRGPHSWLGRVRSSSPAMIDVYAIIGDGPVCFVQ